MTSRVSVYYEYENFNPDDPTLAITGYGVLTLKGLRSMVARKLSTIADQVKSGNSANLKYEFGRNDWFLARALLDAEELLDKPATKRKLTMMKRK